VNRRLAAASILVIALSGGASAAHALLDPAPPATMQGQYWACAGVRDIDLGICVEDPLPERLPLPEGDPTAVHAPEVPAVPVAVPPVEVPAVPVSVPPVEHPGVPVAVPPVEAPVVPVAVPPVAIPALPTL
jgi:hypothetical protein